jgi:orotate phosphoribosyltransferase
VETLRFGVSHTAPEFHELGEHLADFEALGNDPGVHGSAIPDPGRSALGPRFSGTSAMPKPVSSLPKSPAMTEWDRDAALTAARLLLEIKAVNFRPEEPYTFTSGWKSPVYIDCRRIIAFPRARAKICELAVEKIGRHVGYETIEVVAGGETAGIPFAAWIADRMLTPMAYVRKQAKGVGKNALIEGDVPEGRRTLLVEDLTTDGQSKIRFCQALRDAGAIVNHTFVVFFYGVFPGAFETLARMDIALHHLCTWWDVLEACRDRPYFADTALGAVRRFLEDPVAWSAAHGGISSAEEAAAPRSAHK